MNNPRSSLSGRRSFRFAVSVVFVMMLYLLVAIGAREVGWHLEDKEANSGVITVRVLWWSNAETTKLLHDIRRIPNCGNTYIPSALRSGIGRISWTRITINGYGEPLSRECEEAIWALLRDYQIRARRMGMKADGDGC